MLLGTWAGRFEAAISVPGSAIGAIIDGVVLRHERRQPRGPLQHWVWVLPVAATVAAPLAVIRSIDEQVDPVVAIVSVVVMIAAAAVLWLLLVARRRLPRTTQAERTELLRGDPVAEPSMREDLAATVAIYRERGMISDQVAQRALDLGPGRLAELDRS